MGENSAIAWTTHTFNPWWGCVNVSAGCAHCYAEAFAHRMGMSLWTPGGERRMFGDAHWNEPRKWDRKAVAKGERARVFCASMADLFEDHPALIEPRARVFGLIEETPGLDWLFCTKRIENVAGMAPWGSAWPRNVWMLATVEDQTTANERVPVLLSLPAAVRGLSLEPLLGPVDVRRYLDPVFGLDWLIVGGESGPRARECFVDWVRDLVKQGRDKHVPMFVKQLGAAYSDPINGVVGVALRIPNNAAGLIGKRLADPAGRDPAEWPEDLRVREFPAVRDLAWRR